jgi:cytochrome c peroxidase
MRRWLVVVAAACSSGGSERPVTQAAPRSDTTPAIGATEINPRLLRRFRPVATEAALPAATPEKIALGRMLFFETRLSRDGNIACNTCHPLDRYGADGQPTSVGATGRRGLRNTPTVYNAASHVAQFWDGRSPSVEDQAVIPILSEAEMGMRDEAAVIETLRVLPGYAEAFRAAYPGERDPITLPHLGEAIGAFERGLVTASRWDDFLAGRTSSLTLIERRGLRVFLDAGCMVCHTGPQVGGTMFERVGVVEPWPNQRDPGRAGVTNSTADLMVFKVPSLKNIAMTAPYFHDGSAVTLEAAISMMGRHQLGIELSDDDIAAIAAWMRAMTGAIDHRYIEPPVRRLAPVPPASDAAARHGRAG